MDGLYELLNRKVTTSNSGRDAFFDIYNNHYSPGFWAGYVARARARNLSLQELDIHNVDILNYAKAIAIERALAQQDTYPYARKRAGEHYSPLVLLETREGTDAATGEINRCIRGLFGEAEYAEFVSTICELVGDLLDNVWAHGKATGFSMAQKWRDPTDGFLFEFAVADCGMGFLRELQRVGMPVTNDRAAIEWCIQPGNSTKKRDADEWEQRLPPDVMGNPMGLFGRVVESDNHHMGLGLAKLITAVEQFHGWCWLASGNTMLCISPNGQRTYENLPIPWQGVALACRFDSKRIAATQPKHTTDEFEDILSQLMKD
ncbi:MAG: hypothetical protein KKH12_10235 [Gammaproteobacteria bacterium]|nr:hypothetical protein [Gammaproteobacteria bacterium]